jgi:putative FmdB family regulatory protein
MPIYEYECEKCHHRFELKKSFGEDGKAHCPQCRGKAARIFTSVPIIFKGSGFYVTDHKKSNPASTPENKEKSPSTPDKKAEKPKTTVDPKMD